MINVVSNLIGALTMMLCSIFIWKTLYGTKIDFKNYKMYVFILITLFFMIFNYFYNLAFIRILVITFVLLICNKIIFRENAVKTIVSTILGQIIVNISDILFAVILVVFLKYDVSYIHSNIFGNLLANVLVGLISMIIVKFNFVVLFYNKLVNISTRVRSITLMNFSLLLVISINILLALIYYKVNSIYVIIINFTLILVYSFIVYKTINERNNSLMVKAENNSLLESLSEYENMLDRQRIDNHENKNQLLIIKNMIKKDDKDVIQYIDTIVTDQKEDDEVLYTKVKTIPSGGLQGIIYQKMLVIKDRNIEFSIDVSRDVRKINLDNFSMNDNYKLCKIIGVFLDNAIEESVKVDDKKIIISLYEEDEKLIIEVSNKFDGVIDLDSIDNEGYTTKGDGHGYGLSLVKRIISESDVFINERQINNNIFKQVIKVKVK